MPDTWKNLHCSACGGVVAHELFNNNDKEWETVTLRDGHSDNCPLVAIADSLKALHVTIGKMAGRM